MQFLLPLSLTWIACAICYDIRFQKAEERVRVLEQQNQRFIDFARANPDAFSVTIDGKTTHYKFVESNVSSEH